MRPPYRCQFWCALGLLWPIALTNDVNVVSPSASTTPAIQDNDISYAIELGLLGSAASSLYLVRLLPIDLH